MRIKQKEDKKSVDVEGKFFNEILLWQKICILLAGVTMNLILAVIIRIIIFIAFPDGGLEFN